MLPRLNRAATTVRWSPNENKFAIGSGARLVSICYFEEEGNWWVCKQLKKPFKSTITCVNWHFNNVLLATGSTDGHARVVSAYIKSVDQKPPPTPWGTSLPFNTICLEYLNNSAGWVQDVAFSPSGDVLAFVAHDSTLNVVYPSAPDQPPKAALTIMTTSLPLASLIWTNENQIIAAGYVSSIFPAVLTDILLSLLTNRADHRIQDCDVYAFNGSESGWSVDPSLQKAVKKSGAGSEQATTALQMFRSMDLRGKADNNTTLNTIHQNAITRIRSLESDGNGVTKFATSGSDGRVVVWSVPS